MSELQPQILESTLKLPFRGHVNEAVTSHQYKRQLFNHENLGIGSFLDEKASDLGYDGPKARWDAYRHILSGITDSSVEADFPRNNEYTTTHITFKTKASRRDFHTISSRLHNGISVRPPELYDNGEYLEAVNYTYAEACAIGRTGTMLLTSAYPELKQNIRAIKVATLGALGEKAVFDALPSSLQEQAIQQAEAMGEIATQSLFVSGMYGLVGYKFREEAATLSENDRQQFLRVQRKTPPLSERSVLWLPRLGEAGHPISQGSLSRSAIAPTVAMVTDTYNSAKRREYVEAAGQTWDILRELGGTRGVGSVVRALLLYTRVLGKATVGKYQDSRLLKQLDQ